MCLKMFPCFRITLIKHHDFSPCPSGHVWAVSFSARAVARLWKCLGCYCLDLFGSTNIISSGFRMKSIERIQRLQQLNLLSHECQHIFLSIREHFVYTPFTWSGAWQWVNYFIIFIQYIKTGPHLRHEPEVNLKNLKPNQSRLKSTKRLNED